MIPHAAGMQLTWIMWKDKLESKQNRQEGPWWLKRARPVPAVAAPASRAGKLHLLASRGRHRTQSELCSVLPLKAPAVICLGLNSSWCFLGWIGAVCCLSVPAEPRPALDAAQTCRSFAVVPDLRCPAGMSSALQSWAGKRSRFLLFWPLAVSTVGFGLGECRRKADSVSVSGLCSERLSLLKLELAEY